MKPYDTSKHADPEDLQVFDTSTPLTTKSLIARGFFSGSGIAVIMLVLLIAIGCAFDGINQDEIMCLTIIAAGVAGGLLQQLWFNIRLNSRMGYPTRLAGFGLTYFAVLAGCAYVGTWLPTDNPWAWASFAVTFLVILAIVTAVITHFIKRNGATYNQLLAEYRKKQEAERHE